MNYELFAVSKNGKKITWLGEKSHAITHFNDAPGLEKIAKQIIETTNIGEGREIYLDVDMGRTVGKSGLVETDETDEIVYAIRKNRNRYTVFAKNRKPEPCTMVHVVIRQRRDGSQWLFTSWIGPNAPSFPNSKNATPESREFWSKHALVWGQQKVVPGTETTECPW